MFDVQDMQTGELILEMASAEDLISFADMQFPFEGLTQDPISGVAVKYARNLLESRGFKVYELE